MKLADLEPQFVRYETRTQVVDAPALPEQVLTESREYVIDVGTLGEAQGVQFLCPRCFERNGGAVGTHAIAVTFEGRGAAPHQGSQNHEGHPSRWGVRGASLADLTLSPSIDLRDGCAWHGFVTNGEVTSC